MAVHEYRELKPTAEAEAIYRRWLARLNDDFTRHQDVNTRSQIVRDELIQLYFGHPYRGPAKATLNHELAMHSVIESFDPRNATLEPEYYGDVDAEKYAVRKPLIWFWQMFDRSPIGLNHWLGIRFRCMLGRHIFDHVGTGVKIYHGVDLTYGYNTSIGDGVTIRKGVLLNDRGGITIGKGVVLGSFARVFSYSYSSADLDHGKFLPTFIGDGARIGTHESVMAGTKVPPGTVIGDFPAERA